MVCGSCSNMLRWVGAVRVSAVREPPQPSCTAPCLALAALTIAERAPAATFVSLPADHTIGDPARFRATLTDAFGWAKRSGASVTLGIVPTAPETGYGYIRVGEPLGGRAFR